MYGLHLRTIKRLDTIISQAEALNIEKFQCFTRPDGKERLEFTTQEIEIFKEFIIKTDKKVYIHAPYWISLASLQFSNTYRQLRHELERARNFHAYAVVLHAGAATGFDARSDALRAAAKTLNLATNDYPDIQLILENSAHGGNSLGGELIELAQIKNEMQQPEKIKFCIDTAHAFAFGYDMTTLEATKKFCDDIAVIFGEKNIALLHINNCFNECASRLDRHELLWNGMIPLSSLEQICCEPYFADIPIINEPPVCTPEEAEATIMLLSKWKQKKIDKDLTVCV
jgi:apurinic endonuclease APN1